MRMDQQFSPSFSNTEQYPDTGESGDVYDCEAIQARDESRDFKSELSEREWFVEDFMQLHRLKLFILGKGRMLKSALAEWEKYCNVRTELGIPNLAVR